MTTVKHPPIERPLERIMVSRASLRQALRTLPAQAASKTNPSAHGPSSGGHAHTDTGTDVLLAAIRAWWARHPLHDIATDAAISAKVYLRPIAQRNPLGLVCAALLLGGLVAWARPWRWISVSGLFAGTMPQVIAEVLAQIRPATWGEILSALLAQGQVPKN